MLKHRILIVEDDASVIRNLQILLMSDYEVIEASDGQTGHQIAQIAEPDLIIMDIVMPRMNGIELCNALKVVPHLQFVPIIVITGYATPELEERLKKVGVEVILKKPFEMSELMEQINKLLYHVPATEKRVPIHEIQGFH